MSEEKKIEETKEDEETTETPSLEKRHDIPTKIKTSEAKGLGGVFSQIKLFDENLKKTLEVIDVASFLQVLNPLRNMKN